MHQEADNFEENALAWFARFKNAPASSTLYKQGMTAAADINAAFHSDVTDDSLPKLSWIIAPSALSEHPNYQPPDGKDLSARLINALASNTGVGARTVFILNYDETVVSTITCRRRVRRRVSKGGASTVSTAGELTTVNESGGTISSSPIGLGIRVPMMLVSPWTYGSRVCSKVFDHTSALQFLEQRFGVKEPNISAWRRTVCGHLTSAFNFNSSDPR